MASVLVTFAVREESGPFQRRIGSRPDLKLLLTGIGRRNAERTVRRALADGFPELLLTCGFAGALHPELTVGTVIFSEEQDPPAGTDPVGRGSLAPPALAAALLALGARPAKIHCAGRVAVTAEEKRELRRRTGADAVEMESGIICALCRERGIRSATVRVISDSAEEDLPLDFNRLLDAGQNLSYGKLALALVKAPQKASALLRLQRQTRAAAEKLAAVLLGVIPPGRT